MLRTTAGCSFCQYVLCSKHTDQMIASCKAIKVTNRYRQQDSDVSLLSVSSEFSGRKKHEVWRIQQQQRSVLWPFVRNYPGEPAPEETFTHSPSWSLSNLYQLLPSTTIHSILSVQTACLAIFSHNLSPRPFWSTSWSGASTSHSIFGECRQKRRLATHTQFVTNKTKIPLENCH